MGTHPDPTRCLVLVWRVVLGVDSLGGGDTSCGWDSAEDRRTTGGGSGGWDFGGAVRATGASGRWVLGAVCLRAEVPEPSVGSLWVVPGVVLAVPCCSLVSDPPARRCDDRRENARAMRRTINRVRNAVPTANSANTTRTMMMVVVLDSSFISVVPVRPRGRG